MAASPNGNICVSNKSGTYVLIVTYEFIKIIL